LHLAKLHATRLEVLILDIEGIMLGARVLATYLERSRKPKFEYLMAIQHIRPFRLPPLLVILALRAASRMMGLDGTQNVTVRVTRMCV
jgi:hypothetical protein